MSKVARVGWGELGDVAWGGKTMNRVNGVGAMLAAMAAMLGGCTGGLKQEIVHLENQNRSIAAKLERAEQQLEAAEADSRRFAGQIAAVQTENDQLLDQIAELADRDEPAPPPPPASAQRFATAVDLFRVGQAGLKPEAGGQLDAVVSAVQGEFADKAILIVGHTDNAPIKKSGWQDNYELSAQRALSVARYLKDAGIDPSRLIAAGSGEHRPRAANDTEAGRSANRRIEFYAIELPAR